MPRRTAEKTPSVTSSTLRSSHAVKSAPGLLLLVVLLTGCAGVPVTPPPAPQDPVSVFLLDHGRHSSLVLPGGLGGMLRYSYGDWEFYALRRTSLATGLAALFGPTQAALGRKALPGPMTELMVRQQVRIGIERLFELRVERDAVNALHRQLEEMFHDAQDARIYNAEMDVEFVPHPIPYSLNHNSNRVAGEWLEALGCTVGGRAVFSRWRIVHP